MKKNIIVLFVCLFVTAGCNTKQIEETISSASNFVQIPGMPGSTVGDPQQSQGISKDIEDSSCMNIPYQKRTVCRIQVHLKSLGYNAGTADGIAGRTTKAAITTYQSKRNIRPADGKPSYDLLTQLRKDNLKGQNPLMTGAISAAACATVAKYMKKDVATWALVCGGSGAVLQGMANKGREEYAMRYYEIKDENERTENEINQLAKQMRTNEDKVKSYQSEVERLIAKEKNDKQFVAKATKLRAQLDEQARLNKGAKSKAELKIAILEDQINDVEQILAQKPNEEEFKMTLVTLEKRKATLVDAVNESNGIERDLFAQKSKLDEKIVERS